MESTPNPEHYRAIVDMGSNGIRFSITDFTPITARIMPTIYQDRTGISLYDAQWSTGTKQPIPDKTTEDVILSLLRFKRICEDFGVRNEHVRILATEATRQAMNSEPYREAIRKATGWTVEMLPKEEEGRVGAMGVVSSFSTVKGIMMDLGGGSTQITWLVSEDGHVRMSDAGSVSMPYGAAALMRRLSEAAKLGGHAGKKIKEEITNTVKEAVATIGIPQEVLDTKHDPDGLTLYLSGGGFRGWGFLLMDQHPVSPYPIPIINGFRAPVSAFRNTQEISATAADDDDIFRISERRASQVPAVALLVSCMLDALPAISTVRFAQGGVREGSLYTQLPADIKEQYPFVTGTLPFTTASTPALHAILKAATPASLPSALPPPLITALAQSLYLHNALNKDLKSAAALRATTTGALAGIHGAGHDERAALAIMLCERWGGFSDLPPGETGFYERLLQLLGAERAWWCVFYGRVAALIGIVHPAGKARDPAAFSISASWSEGFADQGLSAGEFRLPEREKDKAKGKGVGKKEHKHHEKDKSVSSEDAKDVRVMKIVFDFGQDTDDHLLQSAVQRALRNVEKLGKKKNWPNRAWGCKIDLRVKGGNGEGSFGGANAEEEE